MPRSPPSGPFMRTDLGPLHAACPSQRFKRAPRPHLISSPHPSRHLLEHSAAARQQVLACVRFRKEEFSLYAASPVCGAAKADASSKRLPTRSLCARMQYKFLICFEHLKKKKVWIKMNRIEGNVGWKHRKHGPSRQKLQTDKQTHRQSVCLCANYNALFTEMYSVMLNITFSQNMMCNPFIQYISYLFHSAQARSHI